MGRSMGRVTDISARVREKRMAQSGVVRVARAEFIGRAAELDAIDEHLRAGDRLVTVVGPPGHGKTRLATHFGAERARPRFDRVVFVDLTGVDSGEKVGVALAASLGAERLDRDAPPELLLAQAGRALVILDNFEHVVESAAPIVAGWLTSAPAVAFLVTSREALQIGGEARIELDRLVPEEGVELFVERARVVRPSFERTPEDEPTLRAIVERLEGNALAIELAAARSGVLSPSDLLARLSTLGWLKSAERGAPARHATLRAAIDWSWQLLSEHERRALAQLSLFRGGFDLAAAEAILELGEGAPATIDLLEALSQKSLLRVSTPAEERTDRLRFGLYESVREHAREQHVSREEEGATRLRHALHFAERAERCARGLEGNERRAHAATARLEHENLVAAHAHALAIGDADAACRLALALASVIEALGPLALWLPVLESTIEASGPSGGSDRAAKLACARANALAKWTRVDDAAREIARAEALLTDREAPELRASLAASRGFCALLAGEMERACAHYRVAVDRAREADAPERWVNWLLDLAHATANLDRLEDSRAHFDEALAAARAHGLASVEIRAHAARTVVELAAGDVDAAIAFGERALEQTGTEGSRLEMMTRFVLGLALVERGRVADAALQVELLDSAGSGPLGGISNVDALRAVVLAAQGRPREAETKLRDARAQLSGAWRYARFATDVLEGMIDVAHARAAMATGEASSVPRYVERARARLERMRRPQPDGSRAPVERSAHVRLAVGVVERALARLSSEVPFEVGPEARWFRVPRGEVAHLGRRRVLRALLARLVAERLAAPGAAVPLEVLQEAGWPGQRMRVESATHRLQVAMWELRKLGLKELLLTAHEGYLLDPGVPLVQSDGTPG